MSVVSGNASFEVKVCYASDSTRDLQHIGSAELALTSPSIYLDQLELIYADYSMARAYDNLLDEPNLPTDLRILLVGWPGIENIPFFLTVPDDYTSLRSFHSGSLKVISQDENCVAGEVP